LLFLFSYSSTADVEYEDRLPQFLPPLPALDARCSTAHILTITLLVGENGSTQTLRKGTQRF